MCCVQKPRGFPIVIIDALDECSEVGNTRSRLLSALRALGAVNLLVTSRDLASIAKDFHDAKRLDIYANDDDVRRYIVNRIPREPRLANHVLEHPKLQEEIASKILEKVGGM